MKLYLFQLNYYYYFFGREEDKDWHEIKECEICSVPEVVNHCFEERGRGNVLSFTIY